MKICSKINGNNNGIVVIYDKRFFFAKILVDKQIVLRNVSLKIKIH